jgi:hypothetical protein
MKGERAAARDEIEAERDYLAHFKIAESDTKPLQFGPQCAWLRITLEMGWPLWWSRRWPAW